MTDCTKIKFEFPLYLTEKKEEKERFIFEGFAAANDFDLHDDIISDQALRKCINDFKKEGKFCINHTDEEIGKLLDCHFKKGKIWVKTEVTKKSIIKKVKSGELNCLSIKGQIIKSEKVELLPDLRLTLIKELHLIEVSLVPQGANPEARAIRWYITKAIKMAEANKEMKKKKINLAEEETEEETSEETEGEETPGEETEEDSTKEGKEEDEDEDEDEEDDKEETEEEEGEKKTEGETKDGDEEGEEKEEETKSAEIKEAAKWTTAYINDLPNSSFAYIEAGGKKDKEGKTVPRSLRHLPYKDANGKVDLPHLRNAIARAPHVKGISVATVKRIQSKLRAILAGTKKNLSEEKIVYSAMNSGNIELEDKKEFAEFKKELLRVGKWQHDTSRTGVLDVTKEMLRAIIKNFKAKVLDNIFVPLGHPTTDDPSKNVGEVAGLELSKDEDKLIATIDVKDETVAKKIKKGLIRGISASFAENYMKKDTGEKVGPTLFHAALVNEPYVKGMEGFVPLSEGLEDSLVIPIINTDSLLTLSEITEKIGKIEEKIKLNENDASEETSEEETSEEETSEETKSPEVSKEAEEGEEDKTEETETEETETEEESEETEAKEGVELAEAEKMFEVLLKEGKVTPAEKELLLPLLTSDTPIELADGKKVDLRKAMKKYLKSRNPVFSLDEYGTTESDKKEEKIPEDVKKEMDKMGLSEDIQKETFKDFKKSKEETGKEGEKSTPF